MSVAPSSGSLPMLRPHARSATTGAASSQCRCSRPQLRASRPLLRFSTAAAAASRWVVGRFLWVLWAIDLLRVQALRASSRRSDRAVDRMGSSSVQSRGAAHSRGVAQPIVCNRSRSFFCLLPLPPQTPTTLANPLAVATTAPRPVADSALAAAAAAASPPRACAPPPPTRRRRGRRPTFW